ncbi:MAG: hypothetical protein ACK506_16350 [Pirellula sp.]
MLPKNGSTAGKSGVITHAICCDARDAMNGLPIGFYLSDCRSPAPMVDASKLHPVYAVRPVISCRDGRHVCEIRFNRDSWFTAWRCVRDQANDPNHPMTFALAQWCQYKIKVTAKYHGWI